jgi:aspartyl-tRNA(Asn)/glutamyl-tRNA(Gln) amidotransferase subunit C
MEIHSPNSLIHSFTHSLTHSLIMKVDHDTLQKIAHLSRLEVRPDEETDLLNSLNGVLTWMEQLNEVDTTGVEPLMHISPDLNVLREDVVAHHLPREQALANAPQHEGPFFQVPKVME